eukprot:1524779-Amphidinium_carterae.1
MEAYTFLEAKRCTLPVWREDATEGRMVSLTPPCTPKLGHCPMGSQSDGFCNRIQLLAISKCDCETCEEVPGDPVINCGVVHFLELRPRGLGAFAGGQAGSLQPGVHHRIMALSLTKGTPPMMLQHRSMPWEQLVLDVLRC